MQIIRDLTEEEVEAARAAIKRAGSEQTVEGYYGARLNAVIAADVEMLKQDKVNELRELGASLLQLPEADRAELIAALEAKLKSHNISGD